METNYKITVPKPCHEDWNQMTPDQAGRFCNSCVKSVVDFTNMKAPEIQEYFIKNQGKSVCGRFKNEQINEKFNIQIPESILHQRMSFHKAFLLTLFVVMGSSLFSCKNHNNATLGEVSVVNDTIKQEQSTTKKHELLGKVDMKRYDSLVKAGVKMPPLPPPPPIKQVKFVKPIKNKVLPLPHHTTGIVAVNLPDAKFKKITKDEIYNLSVVEVKPDYPGGIIKLYGAFKSDFKVPEEYKDANGKIILSFVVEPDGSLSNLKIVRGINDAVDKEVIRFMKTSPKWIPGELHGEKVRVSYAIPIKITAQ